MIIYYHIIKHKRKKNEKQHNNDDANDDAKPKFRWSLCCISNVLIENKTSSSHLIKVAFLVCNNNKDVKNVYKNKFIAK